MKSLITLIAMTLLPAFAGAAEFADLQKMDAAAMTRVNPFPNPSNPDSCYLQGLKDGLCVFKCRSGESFQVKPVKPEANSLYVKCGAADYRAEAATRVNPFPNPSNPDSCYLKDFKDGLCVFKCRNGETFQAKPVKPEADSLYVKCGAGDYRGPQIPDAGSILAQIQQQQAAQQQAIISQQMQKALGASASLRRELKSRGVNAKVGLANDLTKPAGYALTAQFNSQDEYELVKDLLLKDGDTPSYQGYLVMISFAKAAALRGDDKALKVCWLKAMEKDTCVYSCKDGSTHTQPMQRPNPWEQDQNVIPCPQLVFPF